MVLFCFDLHFPHSCIDNMSQCTPHALSMVATTSPRGAAYRRTAVASLLTSVTDQETSYDIVAMHDGSTSGGLRYNEVNVHSGGNLPDWIL